ncbi:ornithine cyclodeaminase [Amycolatopsis keratiniphila]|uniref:Ornithine cyclodeaminase n=1 Tax=Amycolatopsis keratiniphila subsp. keratiniphila TaxID=227715 RepID=A0A1W2LZF1_9PSEU|nr:ornithine cyclodeaminase [Amycolatopsis keratiniphila]OLZ58736.1 ornithine cyclodeaminase [Amycolatopsis keratiniphila subsp. nogabecina]ONF72604.1 ornithine cyclodeaminase [Amycolatopsis keratiniphila subsp. keratiniphila]SDU69461.1 ornithine cyclodeaminase [Amycolatopsis keratiniphila]
MSSGPSLHVLTRSDLHSLELTPAEAITMVEDGYLAYAAGASRNPAKLMVPMPDPARDAVAYSMLGYDGSLEQAAFKTSYRQGSTSAEKYYTTITLYDDTTGLPFALMDCHRVGATRTPASTALIARSCARPGARSALMVGTGAQGIRTLPYLLTALPELERLRLFGTHPDGLRDSVAAVKERFPDREVELVDDVEAAARESDIVVAASGRAAHPKIRLGWLPPGGLLISVASKGVQEGTLAEADYTVATSGAQVEVTGQRMAGPDGVFRIDAELPEILAGKVPGRRGDDDRVFAFSSGMIITDIPVAHALAARAIAAGRGREVALWT